jgi:hypothetical protein
MMLRVASGTQGGRGHAWPRKRVPPAPAPFRQHPVCVTGWISVNSPSTSATTTRVHPPRLLPPDAGRAGQDAAGRRPGVQRVPGLPRGRPRGCNRALTCAATTSRKAGRPADQSDYCSSTAFDWRLASGGATPGTGPWPRAGSGSQPSGCPHGLSTNADGARIGLTRCTGGGVTGYDHSACHPCPRRVIWRSDVVPVHTVRSRCPRRRRLPAPEP